MTPEEASAAIEAALAAERGASSGQARWTTRSGAEIGLPGPGGHGDYASPAVLRSRSRSAGAAGAAGAPETLAARVALRLSEHPDLEWAGVTGAGHLALTLTPSARGAVLTAAAAAGAAYGAGAELTAVVAEDDERHLGRDVARYARARHGATAVLDPVVWRRATTANPAYAVQLAHARACRIARRRPSSGRASGRVSGRTSGGAARGGPSRAFGLVALWPRTLRLAAGNDDPRAIAGHLELLAAEVEALEPRPGTTASPDGTNRTDGDATLLAAAAGAVLAAGLGALGVTAPERM